MIIQSIKLTNFRNHSHYLLECKDQTSLILGKNGCGKTSVLEALYISMRGKSFRATDLEIVKRDTNYYRIELKYHNGETIIVTYDGHKKMFTNLDQKFKRLPQKFKYPLILFLPSDLNLISHSPGRRRDYFDLVFSGLDKNYATNLSKYKKTLRQRNEILKKEQLNPEELFSWNILLSRLGTNIYNSRKKYITKINSLLPNIYYSIANNQDQVIINYNSEINQINENQYLNLLEKNYQKDFYLGHTTFGIHRDDYLFLFNQKPADGSASRGEIRSIILALKFIESKLIENLLHQKPLILLDDVFSELDETHRKSLIKNFQDHQVILTSVENIN